MGRYGGIISRVYSFLYGDLTQLMIDEMLLGSPQLEILTLSSAENLNIHSTSLRKLTLVWYGDSHIDYNREVAWPWEIWTPNLETLEISGFVFNKRLQLDAPSLVEAILCFYSPTSDEEGSLCNHEFYGEMLDEIFFSIQHVEKSLVGDWCIKVLAKSKQTDLPSPLLNVKCLTLDALLEIGGLAGIVNLLLKLAPNAATLAIQNADIELYGEYDARGREPCVHKIEEYFKSQIDFTG